MQSKLEINFAFFRSPPRGSKGGGPASILRAQQKTFHTQKIDDLRDCDKTSENTSKKWHASFEGKRKLTGNSFSLLSLRLSSNDKWQKRLETNVKTESRGQQSRRKRLLYRFQCSIHYECNLSCSYQEI